MSRRSGRLFTAFALTAGVVVTSATLPSIANVAHAAPSVGQVVISEIYGGGGNAGATYTHDFVELRNTTGASIDLTGTSVQYASATGNTWSVTTLTGSVPAYGYFLVQLQSGGANGVAPPTADSSNAGVNMSGTSGKVAFVANATTLTGTPPVTPAAPYAGASCPPVTTSILDFVGYGASATCAETAATGVNLTNTTSAQRANSGFTDTNNNASDFAVGGPQPQNSATVVDDARPTVISTTPASGATGIALNSDITITFSEPTIANPASTTITCADSGTHAFGGGGGPTTYTLNPNTDFTPNELCTVTITGSLVSDSDANDPPDTMAANYVFSFTTVATDTPPTVASTTPTDGASNVPVNSDVTITFSEPVNPDPSSTTISCANSGPHPYSPSGGGTTFTLDPNTDFANGELCTVTITGSLVTDQDGTPDPMASNYVFSFTTVPAGDPAPEVVSTDPADGATNVSPGANIVVTFSEPVDPALATSAGAFTILCGNTGNRGYSVTPSAGDTVYTLDPTTTSSSLESCTVTVDKDFIKDSDVVDPQDFMLADYVFDFTVASADAPPQVSSTTPANGATGVPLSTSVVLNFSEAVTVPGDVATFECATTGPHSYVVTGSGTSTVTLNPNSNYTYNEICTVTVDATKVLDVDGNDPPDAMLGNYAFSFTTIAISPIHDIQGTTNTSPRNNQLQVTRGIVTAIFTAADVQNGYWIQDPNPDADSNTSEGIFVTCGAGACNPLVNIGDDVLVTGTVQENFNKTRIQNTVGTDAGTVILSSNNPLPAPAILTLPVAGSLRDVNTLEYLESMRIEIPTTLMVTEFFEEARFGHLVLTSGARPYTYTHVDDTPTAGEFTAFTNDLNTRRIYLDDDNNDANDQVLGPNSNEPYPYPTNSYPSGGLSITNRMRAGDTITNVNGVLDWDFSGSGSLNAWRIRPIAGQAYTFTPANVATPTPDPVGGALRVSAFNVLNYFTEFETGTNPNVNDCGPLDSLDCRGADSAAELVRQRDKMIASMIAMNADVAGLIEIANDPDDASLIDIVNSLNTALGAGTYDYIDTGVIGTDAIKTALIYKPSKVTPVGTFKILTATTPINGNPSGFPDTRSRPPLIQTFKENSSDEIFTITVNHFKSKGSSCGGGDDDTTTGAGNCNVTRTTSANILLDYLATDPTGSGDPDFLIMGDLNSYRYENPIAAIKSRGYVDLIDQELGDDAYSFLFDGQVGYLDHALATSSLSGQVTGITEWHINADENPLFDYNDDVRDHPAAGNTGDESDFERESSALPLYEPNQKRSSDHDPIVIGLNLDTDFAPAVTTTNPADGATRVPLASNIALTFDEPVDVTSNVATIRCASSGPHSYAVTGSGTATVTLNPDSNFVNGELCTVTVVASEVADTDPTDPPNNMAANYVFSFTTLPISLIHEVQGTTEISPKVGEIHAVQGIVIGTFTTADVLSGYWVQEEAADYDADPLTSEGIFVTCGTSCATPVAVGDLVRVTGTVQESFNKTRIANTVGTGAGTVVLLNGQPLPASTPLTIPAAGSLRAVSTLENLESMRIVIPATLAVSEFFEEARFGHLVLSSGSRYNYTHTDATPTAVEFTAFTNDLNTRRIYLDDDNNDANDMVSGPQSNEPYPYPTPGLSITNRMRAGDTITNLDGVLDWDFSGSGSLNAWRVRPIAGQPYTFVPVNVAPATPDPVGGTLRVAAFNVLNYFTEFETGVAPNINDCGPLDNLDCRGADSAAELTRQRDKMIASMIAMNPDVMGLTEISNDPDDASLNDIVTALNAVAGPGTYAAILTGPIGTDAIKTALIYKPAKVTPRGAFKVLTSTTLINGVASGFPDTRSRPPLIQTFEEVGTGEVFTVSTNHFKSKGSGCGAGDDDTTTGSGNCNGTRVQSAQILLDYLATDPTGSGDPDFLIMGDLNSYRFEQPIQTIEAGGYENLIEDFVGPNAYSYLFDGQLGYLDHALATDNLEDQVTGVTEWHINADEHPLFDYNDEFVTGDESSFERESNALPLYEPNARRSSDHDPIVLGLLLDSDVPGAPTGATATGGNTSAIVSWTAPADNGGSPITGYTVTSNPGGLTCSTNSPTATTCTVNGLTNGTSYTFSVVATNKNGDSLSSGPSNAVTPSTVPGAPTGVSGVPGDGAVTVSWTAPANGGAAILNYTVTSNPGGMTCITATTSCTVSGLTNGTPYTFTVVATNVKGSGAPSAPSAPVTPRTVPGVPTGVTGVAGNAQVTVSWTAPASNGGSPITGYTATASPGGASCTTATTTCIVTGLTNGTSYVFRVTATNAAGVSPQSAPSAAVTPGTVPGAPRTVTATAGVRSATVNWTAPTSDGGSPITSYTATSTPGNVTCTTSSLSCTITGLVSGTSYTFTVTATNAVGTGSASAPPSNQVVPTGPAFAPLQPTRLIDTRPTEPQGIIPVTQQRYGGEAKILKVKVTGVAGIPTNGIESVSLNVTVVGAAGDGFLTVWSCGERPLSSSLNYEATLPEPNLVIAPVSAAGEICFFSLRDAHIVVDVNGWLGAGSSFKALTPRRVADTRPFEPQGAVQVDKREYVGADDILRLKVTGVAGIPAAGVGAVSLNITAVTPDDPGFLTVFPCGPRPVAANLNYVAGDIVGNAVLAQVSAAGEICIFSSASTHIVVDVNGWFVAGGAYNPLTPQRAVDTRVAYPQGAVTVTKQKYGGDSKILRVRLTGVAGVPASNVAAVSLNVTVDPLGNGFITAFPCGIERPLTASLTYQAGEIAGNGVVAPVSAEGEVCFYSSSDADIVIDVQGWFTQN